MYIPVVNVVHDIYHYIILHLFALSLDCNTRAARSPRPLIRLVRETDTVSMYTFSVDGQTFNYPAFLTAK